MQPLKSYFTKEGWENDLDETAERQSTLFPSKGWYVGGYVASMIGFAASVSLITQQQYALGIFSGAASFLTSIVMNNAYETKRSIERAFRAIVTASESKRAIKAERDLLDCLSQEYKPMIQLDQKIESMIRDAQKTEQN